MARDVGHQLPPHSEPDPAGPPYPSRRFAWGTVALLFLASALSNIDRLVISALVDPIRSELALSDVQMSIIMGPAYGVFYGVFGLGIGLWVDRGQRRLILCAGLALWSLATIASGLAHTFPLLFWARACVGLGEAAVTPAGASLVSDLFPPRLRGRPIALYLVGASLGTGLSSGLPALVMKAAPSLTLPAIGHVSTWREVFMLCGLLGLPLAAAFLGRAEPERRSRSGAIAKPSLRHSLTFFRREWATFSPLYSGFGLVYLCVISSATWGPTFLLRRFSLALLQIGAPLGLALATAGAAGYLVGGLLIDNRRFHASRGRLRVLVLACVLASPVVLCVSAPTVITAIACLAAPAFAASIVYVAMNAALLDLAPGEMRGLALSANSLVSTLIAFTGGPLLVTFVAASLGHDPAGVGWGIVIVAGFALTLAGAAFLLAAQSLHRPERLRGPGPPA